MAKKTVSDVEIKRMEIRKARIVLVGDSPLVVHAWSVKARQAILDKQMKKAKAAQPAKDPDELYQEFFFAAPAITKLIAPF